MDVLKISYDGLEPYQKELFLDIACLWRSRTKYKAMETLEACGFENDEIEAIDCYSYDHNHSSHLLLPHLKVLHLRFMNNLLRTPSFDGIPSLQKLELLGCYKLKDIHPSLGNHRSLTSIIVSHCPTLKMFPTIVHLEKLERLVIEHCENILEFPDIQTNMESLGYTVEKVLRLEGLEIPNGFTSPLLRGGRCRLQLPENWSNEFCGFLMCAVFPHYFYWGTSSVLISMKQVTSDLDDEDDVFLSHPQNPPTEFYR
ncbi:hypothetical protein L1987_30894 [Smallanthus sonchifolius]|uniref:Uncharacterized protein n=1 Tax=Smallanthus sonchifolius TaxID=185202 RepID=A0ACB9I5J9_9ASTR|nr:hypothetical protein L1987_30894 [Smallanthus sonchifolius]